MDLHKLFTDDRAVSPVIGVILMVAITVILAAVIGTFVLGLGDQVSNTSPQASFTFDFEEGTTNTNCGGTLGSDGELTTTHDGGDAIGENRLSISDGTNTISDISSTCSTAPADGSDISAGTSLAFDVESSDTVRIIWEASGGGDTSTLGKWTGPDA